MDDAEATGPASSRLHKRRRGSTALSKVPEEAELLTVLVGGVNFLEQPVTAFVRLDEVSVPTSDD